MTDAEVGDVFTAERLTSLLTATLDPGSVALHSNLAEFFAVNKHRATLLAQLRYAITNSYSFEGRGEGGVIGYASPSHVQWFDDAVLLLEGEDRFVGQIVLFRQGELRYAIAKRDISPGQEITRDDLDFIAIDEFRERVRSARPELGELDAPGTRLLDLLQSGSEGEQEYQFLLQRYPWVLGVHYREISRHTRLDDANIPDFTGLRAESDRRDVIEIKSPFLELFRADDDLNDAFNRAWNQVERYLDFVDRESDYLRRQKGLIFENPKARLLVGFQLSASQVAVIRRKERMNPRIEVLTYEDLLAYIASTVAQIRAVTSPPQM